MKGKSIVMLAVALGCGLVAMFGVQQVLSGNNKKKSQTGQVLVAVREISPGVPIEDSMVTFKKMPLAMIPADAATKPEDYADRSLRVKAFAGTTILRAMLGEPGEHGVSNDIPIGMRIQAIAVNATSAVSGFISPGDRVDIQVTYKKRIQGRSFTRTKTVLEGIEVFAADKNREMQDEESETIYKNISVIVTPDQGNILRLAEKMGELNLSLRNPDDDSFEQTADFTSDDLDDQGAEFGIDEQSGEGDEQIASSGEDLRNLINSETDAEPKEEENSQEPAIWTIIVYAGEEKIVQEIPLPIEKTETESDTDDGAAQQTETQPSAS